MLSRDWQCLNRNCRAVFHSYEHGNPECPRCRCVRVAWMPGGGHVGGLKAMDASLKALAQSFGMTDMGNSPSRSLGRAMPKHDPVVADGPVMQFAPGFAAPFSRAGRATCEPSRQHVDFKVRSPAEVKLPQQNNYPGIGASNWKSMRRQYRP